MLWVLRKELIMFGCRCIWLQWMWLSRVFSLWVMVVMLLKLNILLEFLIECVVWKMLCSVLLFGWFRLRLIRRSLRVVRCFLVFLKNIWRNWFIFWGMGFFLWGNGNQGRILCVILSSFGGLNGFISQLVVLVLCFCCFIVLFDLVVSMRIGMLWQLVRLCRLWISDRLFMFGMFWLVNIRLQFLFWVLLRFFLLFVVLFILQLVDFRVKFSIWWIDVELLMIRIGLFMVLCFYGVFIVVLSLVVKVVCVRWL